MTNFLLVVIALAAALQQTLTGFGFALVVMPLVTLLLGIRTAAPLVALAGFTVYLVNLIRHRDSVDLREVGRLALGSALGAPVGIWALTALDEALVQGVLGALLVAYALYELLRPALRQACSSRWVYLAGFLSGCLGGAYNTMGPPVVVYGALRCWPKEEFRAILQAAFLVNATLVVGTHALAGHFNGTVLSHYLFMAPAILLGIVVGARLDALVNRERFRQLVGVMILLLGVSLII
ncbi:MAG: sulfite exporter TauE/SafE family protein [Chloroflexi bacterium]|nr:sulfite exporter TauE/SafE family protein [Chloroflexota bacterium]